MWFSELFLGLTEMLSSLLRTLPSPGAYWWYVCPSVRRGCALRRTSGNEMHAWWALRWSVVIKAPPTLLYFPPDSQRLFTGLTELSRTSLRETRAVKDRTGRVGKQEVLRPNPGPYICLSAHISCLSFLSAGRKLHISCFKKMWLLCLSPRGVVTPTFWFIQRKAVGMIVSCCLGRSSCTRQFWCILDNRQVKCLIILCLFPKKCMYSSIYITSEYSHGLVSRVKIVNSPLNQCKHAPTHHRLFRSVLKNADVLETVP